MELKYNELDIIKTYKMLNHHSQSELRLIDPAKKIPTISIFVNSQEEFVKACIQYNGTYNIYVGINERQENGTTERDVIQSSLMVIDVDPIRAKDLPADGSELEAAKQTAELIKNQLAEKKINSYLGMSGNGVQVWIPFKEIFLNEINKPIIKEYFQNFQKYLARSLNSEKVKIDNIGDLPRIIKVIGTLSIKGSPTESRPHRTSHWIDCPERHDNNDFLGMLEKTPKEPEVIAEASTDKIKLLLNVRDRKLQELLKGIYEPYGYPSRSEAESGLVQKLLYLGANKAEVFEIMEKHSLIGKWKEAHPQYREMTFNKALEFSNKINSIPEAPVVEVPEKVTFENCDVKGKLNLKDFKYFQKLKPDKSFLVDSMIYPKTTTMLYSPPAQFKSLLALNMALAVATGTEFMGMKCKKYPVLYCDKENNDQLLKDRLMGLWKGQGFKARNMPLKFLTRNGDLMDEDFIEKLKAVIKEQKFKLVFFDTLHRFADYEENKADDINRIYTNVFVPLVDELGCSIIFLHHSKKDGGYRGSGDLLGMVDTCYSVFRQGKTGRFELNCEKSRAGEIENITGEIDFNDSQIRITRLSELICKKEKTEVFRATLANIESIFFGRDLKLTRKEIMERLEMEKIEFSRATVTRALAWCVEEKKTLVKEQKTNAKGLRVDTGRYMNPPKVETSYVNSNKNGLRDFVE